MPERRSRGWDGRKIAALVGVARLNRDSGQDRDLRRVWDKRVSSRTMLGMVTVTATHHTMRMPLCRRGQTREALAVAMRKPVLIPNEVISGPGPLTTGICANGCQRLMFNSGAEKLRELYAIGRRGAPG